jgi:fibronectin type III domain protein/flagellar hook capping protein FlgD
MRVFGAITLTILFFLFAARVVGAQSSGQATVHWTAPGDDSLNGRAASYDLRYSLAPITGLTFGVAARVSGVPAPAAPGTSETYIVTGLQPGGLYYFALKTADEAGNWSGLSNIASKLAATPVDVPMAARLPLSFSPPWPNPARSTASFDTSLPEAAPIDVVVFDVMGRRLRALASGPRPAGKVRLVWDLRDERGVRVMPGVYRVRAQIGGAVFVRALVVTS